jgi:signal transduction histidine kinase
MLAVAVLLHYGDKIPLLSTAAADSPVGLSTRQSVERILILLPVTYATLAYGARGGILTMSIGFAFLLPRAVMASGQHSDHALPEMAGVLVVGILLILVITQQRKDVEIQRATRESLRYFVRQVIRSQEDERRRIAMELHDETAQALLLTCQRLDRLVSSQGGRLPDDVASELIDLRSASVGTLTDLRRLTQHLRPRVFDDHGLVAALEWLTDSLLEDYGIVARVEVAGSLPEQTPEAQLLLFRIAQEALRNAGRHSGATHVTVSLRGRRGRTTMSVTDSGRGFSLTRPISELAKDGKLGLLGMDERARLLGGSLDIRSLPGRGTTITVELPNDGPRLSLRNQDSWAPKEDRDAAIFRALDPNTGVGG